MKDQWTDFEKFVVESLVELKTEVAGLKAKAGLWGSIAGVIVSAAVILASKFVQRG